MKKGRTVDEAFGVPQIQDATMARAYIRFLSYGDFYDESIEKSRAVLKALDDWIVRREDEIDLIKHGAAHLVAQVSDEVERLRRNRRGDT